MKNLGKTISWFVSGMLLCATCWAQPSTYNFALISDFSGLEVGRGQFTVTSNPINGEVNSFEKKITGYVSAGHFSGGFSPNTSYYSVHFIFATFADSVLTSLGILNQNREIYAGGQSEAKMQISLDSYSSRDWLFIEQGYPRTVANYDVSDSGRVVFFQPIPEPSAYVLILAGLVAVGGVNMTRRLKPKVRVSRVTI
jgi:hypothetical protein